MRIADWIKIIRKAIARTLAEDPFDPPAHGWKEDEGGPPQHWVDYICKFDPEHLDERGHLRHPADILQTHAAKPNVLPVADWEGKETTRQGNPTRTGGRAGSEAPKDKIEPTHPTSGKRQEPQKVPPSPPLSFLRHRADHRTPEPQSTYPPQSDLSRSLQFQPKPVVRPQHDTTEKQTARPDEHPDAATPSPLRYPLRREDAGKEYDTSYHNRDRHLPVHEKILGERAGHPGSDPCPASAPVEPCQPFQPESNVPAKLRALLNGKQTLPRKEKTQDLKRNEIPASRDRIEEIRVWGKPHRKKPSMHRSPLNGKQTPSRKEKTQDLKRKEIPTSRDRVEEIRVRDKPHQKKPSMTQEPTAGHQPPCLDGVTPAQMDDRWPCLPRRVPLPGNDSRLGEAGLPWLKCDHLDQEQRGNPWRE